MSNTETLEQKFERLMWEMEERHQEQVERLEAVMRDRDGCNQLLRDQISRYLNKERE
jgi:hypothetical protein